MFLRRSYPIPTPTLPLKGREFSQRKISTNQVRPWHLEKDPPPPFPGSRQALTLAFAVSGCIVSGNTALSGYAMRQLTRPTRVTEAAPAGAGLRLGNAAK